MDEGTLERFRQWLATAMRNAGYDIDKQRGGGRAELADRLGVSRSTITRWLEGGSLPGLEFIEPLAAALNVPVTDVLIGAGILSIKQLHPLDRPEPSPEEAFSALGITDPGDMAVVRAMIERMREIRVEQVHGRDHRQRGVGGPPRPQSLKADEQGGE